MVEKIAAVPGVDVIFAASSDLSSFSGFKQRQPQYEALVTKIHDATMKAGPCPGRTDRVERSGGTSRFQVLPGAGTVGFDPYGSRRGPWPTPPGGSGRTVALPRWKARNPSSTFYRIDAPTQVDAFCERVIGTMRRGMSGLGDPVP
jgi:hypothetical protein